VHVSDRVGCAVCYGEYGQEGGRRRSKAKRDRLDDDESTTMKKMEIVGPGLIQSFFPSTFLLPPLQNTTMPMQYFFL
jgi:hypothetical protein